LRENSGGGGIVIVSECRPLTTSIILDAKADLMVKFGEKDEAFLENFDFFLVWK